MVSNRIEFVRRTDPSVVYCISIIGKRNIDKIGEYFTSSDLGMESQMSLNMAKLADFSLNFSIKRNYADIVYNQRDGIQKLNLPLKQAIKVSVINASVKGYQLDDPAYAFDVEIPVNIDFFDFNSLMMIGISKLTTSSCIDFSVASSLTEVRKYCTFKNLKYIQRLMTAHIASMEEKGRAESPDLQIVYYDE